MRICTLRIDDFFKFVKFFFNFLYRSGPLLASLATKLGGQVCIIESEICIIHCNCILEIEICINHCNCIIESELCIIHCNCIIDAITFSKVVATECCPDDQTAIRRHLVRF